MCRGAPRPGDLHQNQHPEAVTECNEGELPGPGFQHPIDDRVQPRDLRADFGDTQFLTHSCSPSQRKPGPSDTRLVPSGWGTPGSGLP